MATINIILSIIINKSPLVNVCKSNNYVKSKSKFLWSKFIKALNIKHPFPKKVVLKNFCRNIRKLQVFYNHKSKYWCIRFWRVTFSMIQQVAGTHGWQNYYRKSIIAKKQNIYLQQVVEVIRKVMKLDYNFCFWTFI